MILTAVKKQYTPITESTHYLFKETFNIESNNFIFGALKVKLFRKNV